MVGYNMDGPARDRVMKLIEEKDGLESEIREQTAVLEANNVGMNDPLVDGEGYPRNDIDVYKVRHARHRIICLQNDHKVIMKKIEQGLGDVHSDFLGSNGEGSSRVQPRGNVPYANGHASNGINRDAQMADREHQHFAVVGFVHAGSPAELAGLYENDQILQFGSINHSNFSDIYQVHDIVAHSVGQQVQVKVRREHHVLSLTVVPRPWAQPGLLGCQIRRV